MNAGVVIFELLSNDVTTTGIVGTRIYPDVAPQKEVRPGIVYQEVNRIPNNTLGLDGQSTLDVVRMQLTMFSTTKKVTVSIENAVRNVLDGVYNQTIEGVSINWIRFDSSRSYFDQSSDQDGLYVTHQDYKIALIN